MQPPFHRLEEFASLTAQDKTTVSRWAANRRPVRRHQPIRREDDPVASVYFLLSGWVGASLILRDGRRQIVKIHLPGDMLGLPSLALETSGETLEAISDAVVSTIPIAEIGKLFESSPALTAGLFLSTQKERVALMHELSWVGAGSAMERLSAFFVDLYGRVDAAGLVTDGCFEFPLTQQHLGDLLGLTAIHVNRTLKRLDRLGLIERVRGSVRIFDLDGLRRLSPNSPPRFAGRTAWLRLIGQLGAAHSDTTAPAEAG